jgi:DNA-binding response OmpR family regulator
MTAFAEATSAVGIGKKKALLVSNDQHFNSFVVELFKNEDVEIVVIETELEHERVYSELGRTKYDLVIPTNFAVPALELARLINGISDRFPGIKMLVISGWMPVYFLRDIKTVGVEAVLGVPTDGSVLLQSVKSQLSPSPDDKISVLLSYRLYKSHLAQIFNSYGFKCLWAGTELELRELAESNSIDLAIEWQHGEQDYTCRDLLKSIGKTVPIFLSLNLNGKSPSNLEELGYAGTLAVPFSASDMNQKFKAMLTPRKQELLKRINW